ncbi:MAG: thioredoxin family protein [Bacteroidota bacterium]
MEKEIHSIEEARELIKHEPSVMLYFYNDHCAPCLSLRPKIIELINSKYSNIKLRFINSEKQPELSASFGVYENPVLILFFDGRETYRGSKYISIKTLDETIQRPYNLFFE